MLNPFVRDSRADKHLRLSPSGCYSWECRWLGIFPGGSRNLLNSLVDHLAVRTQSVVTSRMHLWPYCYDFSDMAATVVDELLSYTVRTTFHSMDAYVCISDRCAMPVPLTALRLFSMLWLKTSNGLYCNTIANCPLYGSRLLLTAATCPAIPQGKIQPNQFSGSFRLRNKNKAIGSCHTVLFHTRKADLFSFSPTPLDLHSP